MKVSAADIEKAFKESGIIIFGLSAAFDKPLLGLEYYLVTKESFLNDFAPKAKSFLEGTGFGVNLGSATVNCVHQSLAACCYGWGQHHKYGKQDGTLAVGVYGFNRAGTSGHAVVVAICRIEGKIYPVFYDFTTGGEYFPTDYEKVNGAMLLI
jgi:hypothetical protein